MNEIFETPHKPSFRQKSERVFKKVLQVQSEFGF